jgi:O-antigen biosynthesis protein
MIDIILLTYNNLSNTKHCISCLYKYTSDFKLFIVDNKSTDNTLKYLNDLSQKKDNITMSFQQENLGIIKGRNLGYDLALKSNNISDLVCFIDNDQFVSEGWIESYLSLMEKGYDLIGAEGWQMKEDFYPCKKIDSDKDNFNYTGCGGMVVKKKVIEDIGLFDEEFSPMYFEDPDFCWRASDKGYKVGWNIEKKIIHQPHKLLSGGDRVFYFKRNLVRFREKWRGRKAPIFKMD